MLWKAFVNKVLQIKFIFDITPAKTRTRKKWSLSVTSTHLGFHNETMRYLRIDKKFKTVSSEYAESGERKSSKNHNKRMRSKRIRNLNYYSYSDFNFKRI